MGLFEDLWAAGPHSQEDRANQRVEWQDLQAINPSKGEPAIAAERSLLPQDAYDVDGKTTYEFFFPFGGRRDKER